MSSRPAAGRPTGAGLGAGAAAGQPTGSATDPAARWWCEHCEREIPEGEARVMKSGRLRCPQCKRRLVAVSAGEAMPAGAARAGVPAVAGSPFSDVEDDHAPAPWHFKVLAVGTVAYLVYRLIWFVFWLTGHAWHG